MRAGRAASGRGWGSETLGGLRDGGRGAGGGDRDQGEQDGLTRTGPVHSATIVGRRRSGKQQLARCGSDRDRLDFVLHDRGIGGGDGDVEDRRLRDDHPVEGIAMKLRQGGDRESV